MKAILEFALPEDRTSLILAVHATEWALVVSEIDEALRIALKRGHTYQTADEALSATRDTLAMSLHDRGISLDMIE